MIDKVFKVAQIVNEYTVIINGGSMHGIKEGYSAEIYIQGNPVIDPDTKEVLGQADYIKARLHISQVKDKIAVCESNFHAPPLQVIQAISSIMSPEQEKLDVDYNQLADDYIDKEIHIGDLVRVIPNPKSDQKTGSFN